MNERTEQVRHMKQNDVIFYSNTSTIHIRALCVQIYHKYQLTDYNLENRAIRKRAEITGKCRDISKNPLYVMNTKYVRALS